MTDSDRVSWSVLLPVKGLGQAKSRLAGLAGRRRGELALAMACDTVTAVLGCAEAAQVIVITDDEVAASTLAALGAEVVPDEPARAPAPGNGRNGRNRRNGRDAPSESGAAPPADGLNAALWYGAELAAARWPGSGRAALSADLPALRPAEIGQALRAAAAWPSAFVADAPGDGTTLYTAAPGTAFRSAFGLASRARHAAGGAAELALSGLPGLRRDVDTPDDLRDALELGLGPHSAPLAAELLRCAPRGT